MKALVTRLRNDNVREKLLVDDWDAPPAPVANQIKTRTLYSGITNGTERNDLIGGNYAHGDEMLPCPWGYQNVGEVIEVGPDVSRVQVGDVVYSSADHLEYCLFDENFLYVKLPESVDRREAALFGMASVAMRTCRNADVRMGERVLVVGAGFIGQLAAQICSVMGGRVEICDLNEQRLDQARAIGACEKAFNSGGDGWQQHVPDFAYQVIIDLAGVLGMETRLISAAAPRGRLMFIAGRFKVEYDFNVGQGHEITIKQNSHFDNDDLANLCRLVQRGQVRIEPLLKEVVPVADARGIYDTLRDEPHKLGGTVFEW